MKMLATTLVILALAAFSLAEQRPSLRDREAPRATDLLRAEKLADQARKRLKEPPRRGPGWKHGGSGWNAPAAEHAEGGQPVIIDVRPPRRARGS